MPEKVVEPKERQIRLKSVVMANLMSGLDSKKAIWGMVRQIF
jgi:hypothetical protein